MAFNKIIKSQIHDEKRNDLSGFSQAFNAALINSNFVETLQSQIVAGCEAEQDSGKKTSTL